MKLVDLDRLKWPDIAVFDMNLHDECEPMVRLSDLQALTPVVDVVPVEWLQRKRKEALQEGMRPDEIEAVEMVMWMWQKEQEAGR